MSKVLWLAVLAIALFRPAVAGAEGWSLDQLINEAALHYPAVLSKQASRDAAAADVQSAEWQRFPAPSIQTSSDRTGATNFVFRLQQVLWAGGAITNGIATARHLQDASEKGIREAQYDVVSRVIDAYTDAVRQQQRKVISQKNLEELAKLDEAIGRRVESEVSPQVDRRLSQSRLAQATNDLATVNQALTRSLNSLSQLTGKDISEVALIDPDKIGIPGDKEEAVSEAVAVSPGLSRLAFEEEAAQSQIAVKKASYWPSVSLRYEKSINNNEGFYGAPSDNRIMVVLEAQPGAGLSAYSGVASAVARRNAAREERRTAIRDLQRLVYDAWSDMTSARTQLTYAAQAQSSAEEVAESYKRQYIIGRKSWLDVLNTVREATQSQLYVVDIRAQATVAALRIALLTDKLNVEVKK